MNCIILMGRLTADPEMKTTQTGLEVVSFCIAVDRPTAKDAEKQADFIYCTAWRQTAAFINNYFAKGNRIALEGSLQSRKWTDKDGQNRTSFEVVVNRAHFCESKKAADSYNAGQGQSAPPPRAATAPNVAPQFVPGGSDDIPMEELGEDDLPF